MVIPVLVTGHTTSSAGAIAKKLRTQILLGTYAVGDRLPAERELSETLGVSRLTLRSALTHLEAEGLVHAVHGSGTRVLDYRESAGLELFGHLAGLVLSGVPVPGGFEVFSNLMELRRAVAVDAIGLATERASGAFAAEQSLIARPMSPARMHFCIVARNTSRLIELR